ncbi:ThuA domain-containing protein [Actinophytocola gossypii]|uniref:ThuA domain-containing protein n=1 Tax=Actinophytocola gossypii TaxID=2812003 RepID=A0ABT2JIS5_9PSEU|nr:ThuA domain-containing protein [Actinophytocola gossypii]MCT2587686.1 ThuA domain-containing protein [Actinophytocola gossypii]
MNAVNKRALFVRGGWPGHEPVAATDRYAARLTGYEVSISDSLDVYLDDLSGFDLIVQCWSMGQATEAQVAGLSAAVRAGTGFAGWHGGIVDAFRDRPGYHLLTGGQFVHHAKEFTRYDVRVVAEHPIVDGIGTFEVHSEQYYVHADPGNEVLAVTDYNDDPDLPWIGHPTMPVTWVRRHGAGRVFVTTVGHRLADLEVPEVDTMIMRGLAWATR